jgi:hypothetical protein
VSSAPYETRSAGNPELPNQSPTEQFRSVTGTVSPLCYWDWRVSNGILRTKLTDFSARLPTTRRARLVAVILSGARSDGTEGMKAVKAACGITFVQTEDTVKYIAACRLAQLTPEQPISSRHRRKSPKN